MSMVWVAKRVDIFPTQDGERVFENCPPEVVAELISKFRTNQVHVKTIEHPKGTIVQAQYIHYHSAIILDHDQNGEEIWTLNPLALPAV